MSRGGKRKGAGGYLGQVKPRFTDYWTPEEIKQFMVDMKEKAKTDSRIATWCGDHLFGKPVQPIGNDGDKPFVVSGVTIRVRK
jgi:hypothetical protein